MASETLTSVVFSKDVRELLHLLHLHQVRYLIVGGEAVIFYGYARLTGDIDIFYDHRPANVRKLFSSLEAFWTGDIPGLSAADEMLQYGLVVQFGVPPNRIDLINKVDGVSFAAAWARRKTVDLKMNHHCEPIHFIGLEALIVNKRAAGRPKDLDDLRFLRHLRRK